MLPVEAIFIRQVTRGDFWCIERKPQFAPAGGGGQTYIDIPLAENRLRLEQLWSFLGVHQNGAGEWPKKEIPVRTVGAEAPPVMLEFSPRGGDNNRYRIGNQARQYSGGNRHPAWSAENGFARMPDDAVSIDDRRPDISRLKIFIAKTFGGDYWAGFTDGAALPPGWPRGLGLEALFDPGVSAKMLTFDEITAVEIPPLVHRILEAWRRNRNVLLYGPPGTGKTHAMQVLWRLLAQRKPLQGLGLDPYDRETPFHTLDLDLPMPRPIRRDWVTFHQNYGYENFVLSLRPEHEDGGLKLKPRAGVLLDAAISADPAVEQPPELQHASAVLYIDEINRGNVSRIFGEFITFMDPDYRAGDPDYALPVPLNSLRSAPDGRTEPVERVQGPPVRLPIPWHFPREVYVLASMNSVDRAVAPLDTALARRFARIEVGPDMDLLASWLGLDNPYRLLKGGRARIQEALGDEEEDETEFGPAETVLPPQEAATGPRGAAETAWLLLYRLNYELASTLGPDFELGHAYLRDVARAEGEDARFRTLARVWDQAVYPQLQERFVNRPEELLRLLRADPGSRPFPARYLFQPRPRPEGVKNGRGAREVLEAASLEEAWQDRPDDVKETLRHLAGEG
jgi:DNA polymerase III delta prime subunit